METTKDNETLIVSIRCIVYNQAPYLRQCLDGFVMQKTDFRFEAIVHDDASTDDSASIIEEYAEKYPEIIKPILETENQYSKHDGSLRRIVDSACKGKYIALCEGDDYWTDPLKLQKQIDFMESHPEYGMCCTDFDKVDEQGNILHPSYLKNHPDYFEKVTSSVEAWIDSFGYIGPMTWLVRTDFWKSLGARPWADGTYWIVAEFIAKSKIGLIKDNTACYRILSESASHSKSVEANYKYFKGLHEEALQLIKTFVKEENQEALIPRINTRLYKKRFHWAIVLKKQEDINDAKKCLWNEMSLKDKCFYYCSKIPIIKDVVSVLYRRRLMMNK